MFFKLRALSVILDNFLGEEYSELGRLKVIDNEDNYVNDTNDTENITVFCSLVLPGLIQDLLHYVNVLMYYMTL